MSVENPPPLVEARNLTKRYGPFIAVEDLSFAVGSGEIYGLLGPNGAGKTTTILMLLGLSEPSAGEARVLGLDPARQPLEVKRHVGYLPDSVGFYGRLSGRENLEYTARLNGIEPTAAGERITELLAQVGLADAGDKPTDTYSRGMLQRLGVADALVKGPSVLILDEPTASIDPAGVADLLGLIRDLVAERRLAALLSSHLLSQVERLCDRVGIFSHGRLVAEGSVGELAERAGDRTLSLDEVYRRLAPRTEEERHGSAA
ncbi:MAG TPA: ABC transporter ATP-binding protein [Candidatus Limnocylindria bacterium]|nr:ABC transporter ATP-binding protein [Candidatus Limnocylindria bacterium]